MSAVVVASGLLRRGTRAVRGSRTGSGAFRRQRSPGGRGGPGTSTEILNLYAYRTSFTELNIGYGSALAMVLLALTLFISWLLFRRRKAHA